MKDIEENSFSDDYPTRECLLCGDLVLGDGCRYEKIWRDTGVDTRNNQFRINRRNSNGKEQEEASSSGEATSAGKASKEEVVYLSDYTI